MRINYKKIYLKEKVFFKEFIIRQKKHTSQKKKNYQNETIWQRKKRISVEVMQLLRNTVKYGPYKGVKFTNNIKHLFYSDYPAYLFGLYEHDIVKILTSYNYKKHNIKNFVNIGASVGYHAIGLIKNNFYKSAICFEKDKKIRNILKKNIKLNKCEKKIKIFSEAKKDFHLKICQNMDLKKTMFLIDIEGGEFEILDSSSIKFLSDCFLIIEVHHWVNNFYNKYKNLLKILLRHFKINFITYPENDLKINSFQELKEFNDDNRYLICSEHRPSQMRYLLCRPKYYN